MGSFTTIETVVNLLILCGTLISVGYLTSTGMNFWSAVGSSAVGCFISLFVWKSILGHFYRTIYYCSKKQQNKEVLLKTLKDANLTLSSEKTLGILEESKKEWGFVYLTAVNPDDLPKIPKGWKVYNNEILTEKCLGDKSG
ncbi:MAG: hypothetical protein V1492_00175 [Candidatus Micrarchaeota archaeon]